MVPQQSLKDLRMMWSGSCCCRRHSDHMLNCWLTSREALWICQLWKCHEPCCKSWPHTCMWWSLAVKHFKPNWDIHLSLLARKQALPEHSHFSSWSMQYVSLLVHFPCEEVPSAAPAMCTDSFPLRPKSCCSFITQEHPTGKCLPFGCVAYIESAVKALRACCPSQGAITWSSSHWQARLSLPVIHQPKAASLTAWGDWGKLGCYCSSGFGWVYTCLLGSRLVSAHVLTQFITTHLRSESIK